MQEVKRQNINTRFILVVFFSITYFTLISAQYSLEISQSDSLKSQIIQKNVLQGKLVDWKNIQKNRSSMPIFCKWELDIEDATRLPVKFRLGSQEYVDRLEQKGPSNKID